MGEKELTNYKIALATVVIALAIYFVFSQMVIREYKTEIIDLSNKLDEVPYTHLYYNYNESIGRISSYLTYEDQVFDFYATDSKMIFRYSDYRTLNRTFEGFMSINRLFVELSSTDLDCLDDYFEGHRPNTNGCELKYNGTINEIKT